MHSFRYNGGLASMEEKELRARLSVLVCFFLIVPCVRIRAQHAVALPTPLSTLLKEADANNAEIVVAADAWKVQSHVAQQMGALPAPELIYQNSSVGTPVPFGGLSTSEWAYVGFGASQEIPYKGKLKLRADAANSTMQTNKAAVEVVRSTVIEQVKLLYLQIAYSTWAIKYIDRVDSVVQSLIQDATARYSTGQGSQQAILKAQLQRTELQRLDTMHNQNLDQAQARLKQLLHRRQDSNDIVPEALKETPFTRDVDDLRAAMRQQNPRLERDNLAITQQEAQVTSAKREYKPDFNLGYQYQVTGSRFPDHYIFSASIQLPNRGRVDGEIAQATDEANRARHQLDAEVQQTEAEIQAQFAAVRRTGELLKEFTQGLLPQSEAVFHSEESAFQANKEDLSPVLSALIDVLNLENDYQQALFDHEAALVRIETLTGETLR